jgi:hypothetical protein
METLLALTVPAVVAIWAVRSRRRAGSCSAVDRWFGWFILVTLFVSLAGTGAIQMASEMTRTKPVIFDQVRTLRFIYLPLFVFGSYALANLLSRWQAGGRRRAMAALHVAAFAFWAATALPSENILTRLWNDHVHAKTSYGRDTAIKSLGAWVRDNTPGDALIDYDSALFRFCSRRSLVFCKKDGGILLYSGSERLLEWNQRFLEEKRIDSSDSIGRLAFAAEYGAHYLVLPNEQATLANPVLHRNSHFTLYVVTGNAPDPGLPGL